MEKNLRKMIMIAVILGAIQLMSACGSSEKELTTEDFLEDFDYMMQTMEESYPYFGVAERKLGVDIRALAEETRDLIGNYPDSMEEVAAEVGIALEDLPALDGQIFWSILRHEFFSHLTGFAHTYPLDSGFYSALQPYYANPGSYLYTSHNEHPFTNSVSKSFYEEQEALFTSLSDEEGPLFQFVFRGFTPVELTGDAAGTEIIEEGRIAYLEVPSLMGFHSGAVANLRRFYREIQDYEHLIIDIRDNPGGSPDTWRMMIMHPLWPDREQMPDMPLYGFYRGSSLGKALGEENIHMEGQHTRNIPETGELRSAREIIEENQLTGMNEEDLQTLEYGVRFNTSISNIEEGTMQQLGMQNPTPFEGEIWLLTNERNFSGSALFALHAKEMGFATLVGEKTGGAYTTSSSGAFFALPNTGVIVRWDIDYLTDDEGRVLNEFPTTPHYYNREGMDALETVLELIEESRQASRSDNE